MEHLRTIDYLVKLAQQSAAQGIVEEPRVYYDAVRLLPNQRVVRTQDGLFANGEQFPVELTHFTFALRNPEVDETLLQKVAFRIVFDGSYYQSNQFIAAPNWHTEVNAGAPVLSRAVSCYTFDRPLILTSRNALEVRVRLQNVPTTGQTRRVEVTFKGTGLLSNQPYVFSGFKDLANALEGNIDPDRYRNGGAEPIALTDMTVFCSAETESVSGLGDIRECLVQVRSIIDGTQSDFFQGPTAPVLAPMPAVLLGKTVGRCAVHRLASPIDMLPNRSFYVEAIGLDAEADDLEVLIAAHGSILVK